MSKRIEKTCPYCLKVNMMTQDLYDKIPMYCNGCGAYIDGKMSEKEWEAHCIELEKK